MISPLDLLNKNISRSVDAKKKFLTETTQLIIFEKATIAIAQAYKSGGRLYIAGNGGSAADAQHLAAEFVSRLSKERGPLPAEALTVDSSVLTAIGNDYGYEQVFARQIYGKMTKKDVFLAITTSGNSKNIIEALRVCRERSLLSIVLTGNDGGLARNLADYCIIASGNSVAPIQELHIVLAHTLCEYVEISIFD